MNIGGGISFPLHSDSVQADESRAIALLRTYPPQTRVLALPVGTGLIFFSGLQDAGDGMTSYFPVEVMGSRDDVGLLARWTASPPDLVLYFRWSMREYGFQEYGLDYGIKSFGLLKARYRPVPGLSGMAILLRPAQ